MNLGLGLGLNFVASIWTPALLSNIAAWYEDSAGTVTSSGGLVTAWADQSAVGDINRNMSNAGGSLRPTLNAADSDFNNKQSIAFTGSNWLRSGTWSVALVQPFTLWLVAKDTSGTGNKYFCDSQNTGAQCAVLDANNDGSGEINMLAGTEQIAKAAPAGISPFIGIFVFNGASSKAWVNSHASQALAGTVGSNGLGANTIGNYAGGGTFAASKIASLGYVSGVIADADATNLNAYLSAKYGIAVS